MINDILQATLRSFLKDVKYYSLKTEDPLPLKDVALSDGPVDGSYIYKSKYDVARYREKAPHFFFFFFFFFYLGTTFKFW